MSLPKRKPNRLQGYDYSSEGTYFITICSHNRKIIFAVVVGAIHESPEIKLNQNGKIIDSIIKKLENRFNIKINNYVIMPNHIHLIICINERSIRESTLQKRSIISNAIGYLKMNVSKEMHNKEFQGKIWQRSFHDHIIRDEKDYQKIWQYIENNPLKWQLDCFYTDEYS